MWFGSGSAKSSQNQSQNHSQNQKRFSDGKPSAKRDHANAPEASKVPLLNFQPSSQSDRYESDRSDSYDDVQEAENDQLRYTKFMIDGMPGEKHAVLIPDTVPLTRELLEDICHAIRKDPPNMLVNGVGSLRHPANMTTPQLRASPAFSQLMKDASGTGSKEGSLAQLLSKAKAGLGLSDDDFRSHGRDAPRDTVLKDFANRIMERRTAGMVTALAQTTEQSNSWIFTGAAISSFEVFLQQAKALEETNVFCCVAAHAQDAAYMENSELGPELMRYIFESSCQMTGDAVDDFEPIVLTGDLWNPSKNTSNREFHEYGFDFWSFEDENAPESEGHPVFSWAWPWGDLFFFFYHRDFSSPGPFYVDWNFRTPEMWDMSSIPISVETVAPTGYVFFGGQAESKKRAMQLMKAGSPMIFVDNTPSMAKQMSLLLRILKRVMTGDLAWLQKFIPDGERGKLSSQPTTSQLLQALSSGRVLRYIEKQFDCSEMDEGANLSLSDVMAILDLVKAKPRHFKQRTCVVDPLTESPKDVMPALSAVLCNVNMEKTSHLAAPRQRSLALKGWEKHSTLVRNAAHLRTIATGLEVLISLLMVLATILAATMVHIRFKYDQIHEEVLKGVLSDDQIREAVASFPYTRIASMLHFWMLVFPISVGVLMTCQSHFQFSKRWASVSLAAQKVASEIHLFLGNAGEQYSVGGSLACDRFLKQLQDISAKLSAAGIREEDFAGSEDASSEQFGTDPSKLSEHVTLHTYGMETESWMLRMAKSLLCMSRSNPYNIDGAALLMPLESEAYIELRVAPLMCLYSQQIRETSSLRTRLQATIVILLGMSTVMVIVNASVWIPVCLALATTTGALLQWVAPLEMLVTMNNALAALKHVDLQWATLSVAEQRAQHTQDYLMRTTEGISLAVASTLCQAPLLPDQTYISNEMEERMLLVDDLRSRLNSRAGSRIGSRAASRDGSRLGSRIGSRAGSRPGSRGMSRSTSQASSRGESPAATPGGGRRGQATLGAWM